MSKCCIAASPKQPFDTLLSIFVDHTFRWFMNGPRGISRRFDRLPGQKGKLARALFHFFLGDLLDLLGLRDGVFPGVVLLSRRR